MRDLVLKELQREKSLLVWNEDPTFSTEYLTAILTSEAYILDRYARDYLIDLASGLTREDYFLSIAHTRMPFSSVWFEAVFDFPDDGGATSYGALVSKEADGIRAFFGTGIA